MSPAASFFLPANFEERYVSTSEYWKWTGPRTIRFFSNKDSDQNTKSDRGPTSVLQPIPADGFASRGTREHWSSGCVSICISHHRFSRDLAARVCRVLDRQLAVQVRSARGALSPANQLPLLRGDPAGQPLRCRGADLPAMRDDKHRLARSVRQLRRAGHSPA